MAETGSQAYIGQPEDGVIYYSVMVPLTLSGDLQYGVSSTNLQCFTFYFLFPIFLLFFSSLLHMVDLPQENASFLLPLLTDQILSIMADASITGKDYADSAPPRDCPVGGGSPMVQDPPLQPSS